MSPISPFAALLEHLKLPATEVARQCGISEKSAYTLKAGGACGGVLWRRISARYALEIRQAGLTVEDFLAGEILAGRPPGIERRQA